MKHTKNKKSFSSLSTGFVAAFLVCAMSISLMACGKNSDPENDPDIAKTSQSSSASTTEKAKNPRDQKQEEVNAANKAAIKEIIKKTASDYDLSTMTAIQFAEAMGLGWNLGNTLDATGGDGTDPIKQEMSWGNPEITQELIQCVADNGFTTIRIPVTWMHFIGQDYKINEVMLQRVKQVVDWSLDAGLFVILNTHHENYNYKDGTGWCNVTDTGLEATTEELTAIWTQIANYFKDYDERLVFEGLNEPREVGGSNEWWGNDGLWKNVNKLGNAFVDAVRKTGGNNLTRFLMVPAYACSSSVQIWGSYELPDDDRVIMSIHAYIPYGFALDTKGTDKWDAGNGGDTKEISELFKNIQEKLISKGRAAVIGEFGAMTKGMNLDARNAWAKYYVSKAREVNVPVIWWDNNAFTGNGENFGLIRRATNQVFFESIMEEMINAWYGSDFHYVQS